MQNRNRALPLRGFAGKKINIPGLCLSLAVMLLCNGVQAALKIQHWTAPSGARVYFVENHDLPLLDVTVQFAAGSGFDQPGKDGLANMTRHMLTLGAAGMSEEEITRRLANVGAILGGEFDRDRAGLSMRTLSSERERNEAMGILSKLLQQPDFPATVLQREKARLMASLRESETQPEYLAEKAFYQAVYRNHPYALHEAGEIKSIETLSRDDLAQFYRAHYFAENAVIALIGDISRTQAEALATDLSAKLSSNTRGALNLPEVNMQGTGEVRKIAHPAKQSHILMGAPGMRRGDADYFPLYVGNYVLGGGGFVSRLTEEVRQKRGLAYSAYSYFIPLKHPGPLVIGLQTERSQAENALGVVRKTIADFVAQGPTPGELTEAKQNLIGGFPLRIDSNGKIVEYLAVIGFYRLPLTYLDDFTKNIGQVTGEQINSAFKRRVKPQELVTVIVAGPE